VKVIVVIVEVDATLKVRKEVAEPQKLSLRTVCATPVWNDEVSSSYQTAMLMKNQTC